MANTATLSLVADSLHSQQLDSFETTNSATLSASPKPWNPDREKRLNLETDKLSHTFLKFEVSESFVEMKCDELIEESWSNFDDHIMDLIDCDIDDARKRRQLRRQYLDSPNCRTCDKETSIDFALLDRSVVSRIGLLLCQGCEAEQNGGPREYRTPNTTEDGQ